MTEIGDILSAQEQFFKSGRTKDLDFRLENLNRLKKGIIKHETAIFDALKKDLSRPPCESYLTEVGLVLDEIRLAIRRLKTWARPRKVKTPFYLWLASSRIYCEPYGKALIIAPWNYPFQLSISPLIGSIAAGNCSVLKPSEYAPHTAALISEIIAALTGSLTVGKRVMSAAAEYLTPVTLELGGKSPCIVDRDVNLEVAARRIVFGKFINAGQTCIAPDYLLVHPSNKVKLLELIEKYLIRFYGEDPRKSPDYARIINMRHFNRLQPLLEKGDVIIGGQSDPQDLYIAPTVITNLSWDDSVMQDEIFGPILPVLE
ncbi:MAG: aldehyde dehydrogenase family protein, partial [Desulfobacterales bacterium]